MKTRDELAELFAVATAQEYASTDGQPDDLARWAFACADAFVAERERRAVATPPADPVCGVCGGGPAKHLDVYDGEGRPVACCGDDECCDVGNGWHRAPLTGIDAISAGVRAVVAEFDRVVAAVPPRDPLVQTGFCIGGHHGECPGNGVGAFAGPCGCDCHDATPAPALRFTASGALLSTDGHRYATREQDGYSADAPKLGDDFSAVVRIAARDRAHAERIVAAMLPVGRGTR